MKIRDQIRIPMTVLGGAGSLDDIVALWKVHGLAAQLPEVCLS